MNTILKTYGTRDYFDAIIFIGGGFSALTGYTVDMGEVVIRDSAMFDELEKRLDANNKSADLIFEFLHHTRKELTNVAWYKCCQQCKRETQGKIYEIYWKSFGICKT